MFVYNFWLWLSSVKHNFRLYFQNGNRALAAMSGIFGISEARAEEPEIDAVTSASKNLVENRRNIKKLPSVPPKKPEYNPNNLLGIKSKNKDLIPLSNYVDKDFFEHLGFDESSGDYKRNLKDGSGVGALGKYQFRRPALEETGYMKSGKFTGKDGIYNIDDFIRNSQIQEKAVREFAEKNYRYLNNYELLSKAGDIIAGKVADFPVTVSGMIAAAHKEGAPMVSKYFNALEKNNKGQYYIDYDKYTGNTLRGFLAIETRLRTYAKHNENR